MCNKFLDTHLQLQLFLLTTTLQDNMIFDGIINILYTPCTYQISNNYYVYFTNPLNGFDVRIPLSGIKTRDKKIRQVKNFTRRLNTFHKSLHVTWIGKRHESVNYINRETIKWIRHPWDELKGQVNWIRKMKRSRKRQHKPIYNQANNKINVALKN